MFARTLFLFPLILVCCLGLVSCASNDFSQLDKFIIETKTKSNMPSGTAVIVMKEGQIIHEAYFGYANIAANTEANKDTVFYIASTTKAFLALAVLLAEERGEIDLDTTLQDLFPSVEFELINAQAITVKHLLTHTSGIDNEPLTWAASYTGIGLRSPTSRLELVANSYPSANAQLGEFEYSNIGYNILAIWFDNHFGQDWRNTMSTTILDPLHMKKTTGFISEIKQNGWAMAEPYSYKVSKGKTPVYLRKTDDTMYSVGLLATARDTARFVSAQMNDGVVDGREIFSPAIIQKQRKQQIETDGGYFNGYAYGWMTGNRDGHPVRFHTGGYAGASALISYLPTEKVGLVVLHNENGLKANYLSGIIEDAAYGKLLGKSEQALADLVEPQIETLKERAEQAKKRLLDKMTLRKSSKWKLAHDTVQYIGKYQHPLSGKIVISLNEEQYFSLSWGLLQGVGYPHDHEETIEVDFRPGSFDPLKFEIGSTGVTALLFNGVRFIKVDDAPQE